jgi:excisionase family DNA binding protein
MAGTGKIKRFMRPRAAAELLGVSKRTLDTWIQCGLVPHVKIRRVVLIDQDDLEEVLESYKIASVKAG